MHKNNRTALDLIHGDIVDALGILGLPVQSVYVPEDHRVRDAALCACGSFTVRWTHQSDFSTSDIGDSLCAFGKFLSYFIRRELAQISM